MIIMMTWISLVMRLRKKRRQQKRGRQQLVSCGEHASKLVAVGYGTKKLQIMSGVTRDVRRGFSLHEFATMFEPLLRRVEAEFVRETFHPSSSTQFKNDMETYTCLAGESQAIDGNGLDDLLLCNEIFDSYAALADSGLNDGPFSTSSHPTNDNNSGVDRNVTCGIADLENLELDTPPDFQLADLQFGSQESILGWLDRL